LIEALDKDIFYGEVSYGKIIETLKIDVSTINSFLVARKLLGKVKKVSANKTRKFPPEIANDFARTIRKAISISLVQDVIMAGVAEDSPLYMERGLFFKLLEDPYNFVSPINQEPSGFLPGENYVIKGDIEYHSSARRIGFMELSRVVREIKRQEDKHKAKGLVTFAHLSEEIAEKEGIKSSPEVIRVLISKFIDDPTYGFLTSSEDRFDFNYRYQQAKYIFTDAQRRIAFSVYRMWADRTIRRSRWGRHIDIDDEKIDLEKKLVEITETIYQADQIGIASQARIMLEGISPYFCQPFLTYLNKGDLNEDEYDRALVTVKILAESGVLAEMQTAVARAKEERDEKLRRRQVINDTGLEQLKCLIWFLPRENKDIAELYPDRFKVNNQDENHKGAMEGRMNPDRLASGSNLALISMSEAFSRIGGIKLDSNGWGKLRTLSIEKLIAVAGLSQTRGQALFHLHDNPGATLTPDKRDEVNGALIDLWLNERTRNYLEGYNQVFLPYILSHASFGYNDKSNSYGKISAFEILAGIGFPITLEHRQLYVPKRFDGKQYRYKFERDHKGQPIITDEYFEETTVPLATEIHPFSLEEGSVHRTEGLEAREIKALMDLRDPLRWNVKTLGNKDSAQREIAGIVKLGHTGISNLDFVMDRVSLDPDFFEERRERAIAGLTSSGARIIRRAGGNGKGKAIEPLKRPPTPAEEAQAENLEIAVAMATLKALRKGEDTIVDPEVAKTLEMLGYGDEVPDQDTNGEDQEDNEEDQKDDAEVTDDDNGDIDPKLLETIQRLGEAIEAEGPDWQPHPEEPEEGRSLVTANLAPRAAAQRTKEIKRAERAEIAVRSMRHKQVVARVDTVMLMKSIVAELDELIEYIEDLIGDDVLDRLRAVKVDISRVRQNILDYSGKGSEQRIFAENIPIAENCIQEVGAIWPGILDAIFQDRGFGNVDDYYIIENLHKLKAILMNRLSFLKGKNDKRSLAIRKILKDVMEMYFPEEEDFAEFDNMHLDGNSRSIYSAIANIITNARQHGGGPVIGLSIIDGQLQITVTNKEAVMIRDELLKDGKILGRPALYDIEITKKEEGGIGTCEAWYVIVEDHSGKLIAQNTPDGHGQFIIRLPIIDPVAEPAKERPSA